MSRLGAKPIDIPKGVDVVIDGRKATVKGQLGTLNINLDPAVEINISGSVLQVKRRGDERDHKRVHGLMRGLLLNMIEGVTKGFVKQLEISGVGFKAAVQGNVLTATLGYSKPIEFIIPEGVTVEVEQGITITVKGCDKQKVGEVAAQIRSFFPMEPYKGKGIKYKNEHVRRKEGKTVA